jgi:tetratricopeptide (TPR) repeat protein
MTSPYSLILITSPGILLRRKRLLIIMLASTLVLTACSTTSTSSGPATTTPPATAETAQQSVTPTAESPDNAEAEPVKKEQQFGNFTEDQLSRAIIAELAGQRGQSDMALDEYAAMARESSNLSIIQRATRIATFSRQPTLAIEMAQLWLLQEPDAVEPRQTIALELVTLARYRDAFDQLEVLLEQGETVDFRLLSARIATTSNANPTPVLTGLIDDYETLLMRHPQNDSLRLSLSHLYQIDKHPESALLLIRQMLREAEQKDKQRERDPQSTAAASAETISGGDLVVLEVQLLDQLEQGEQSLRRLQQGVRAYPGHKDLRYLYGRRLINDRSYAEARAQFSVLVEQNPSDYDLLYSLALLSMEVNLYAEARAYLQRLVLNGQKLDDAHYYLGFIDGQENRPTQAIEHYMQVRAGSNMMQALRNLTELMVRANRYDEVHTHLDLALMETDLRRIIQLQPQSPVAYNSLGYILADRTNRYQEAYELIRKANELSPNDPAIIDSLGWVQYKLGMYPEARTNLDKAYELFPDAEVAAHLGEVLWVMGDKSAATRVWRNALATQPDSEHIRSAMQRLNPAASL